MVITETRLKNIANGYVPADKLAEPFVILRTHERMRRLDEGVWCYTFVWGNLITPDNEIVSSLDLEPKTAKKLIKLYGMEVVKQTEDGQVYEMPGCPFARKFNKTAVARRKSKVS